MIERRLITNAVVIRSVSHIQSKLLNSLDHISPNQLVCFLSLTIAMREMAVTSNLEKHRDNLPLNSGSEVETCKASTVSEVKAMIRW